MKFEVPIWWPYNRETLRSLIWIKHHHRPLLKYGRGKKEDQSDMILKYSVCFYWLWRRRKREVGKERPILSSLGKGRKQSLASSSPSILRRTPHCWLQVSAGVNKPYCPGAVSVYAAWAPPSWIAVAAIIALISSWDQVYNPTIKERDKQILKSPKPSSQPH